MPRLTPLTKTLRRRLSIDDVDYEIALDPERPSLQLRQLRYRMEFHLPLAPLVETNQSPLFAQEHVRAKGTKRKRNLS